MIIEWTSFSFLRATISRRPPPRRPRRPKPAHGCSGGQYPQTTFPSLSALSAMGTSLLAVICFGVGPHYTTQIQTKNSLLGPLIKDKNCGSQPCTMQSGQHKIVYFQETVKPNKLVKMAYGCHPTLSLMSWFFLQRPQGAGFPWDLNVGEVARDFFQVSKLPKLSFRGNFPRI